MATGEMHSTPQSFKGDGAAACGMRRSDYAIYLDVLSLPAILFASHAVPRN